MKSNLPEEREFEENGWMARPLRLQYEGAMYHVINRGNYRRDVFGTAGAAQAFEAVLTETCECQGWRLHAYVIMRNHFHLAVSTPRANLVDGMHWLQGTYATRFNRFRSERGHLFQGRYQALLIEDEAALARVVNYIHLNPVRARIVPAEQMRLFRWSSLHRYLNGTPPSWLSATDWLRALGLEISPDGWGEYIGQLTALSGDVTEQEKQGFGTMSRGWVIGTEGWRKAVAKDHAHLALSPGLAGQELREMKETRWAVELAMAMKEAGKSELEVKQGAKGAAWKLGAASRLRKAGASCGWIAQHLGMGSIGSVRTLLYRARKVDM